MFPFFEPNLFPLLEGGRLIFYIFLRKGKALLLPLLRSAGAFSRLVAFVSLPPFTPFANLQLGSR